MDGFLKTMKYLVTLLFFSTCCLHDDPVLALDCVQAEWTVASQDGGPGARWSACSKTCAGGIQKRVRSWQFASGSSKKFTMTDAVGCNDFKRCTAEPSPVHGGWSQWGAWGECSVTCGGGTRRRHRECTNPRPQHKGRPCQGQNKDQSSCNLNQCPRKQPEEQNTSTAPTDTTNLPGEEQKTVKKTVGMLKTPKKEGTEKTKKQTLKKMKQTVKQSQEMPEESSGHFSSLDRALNTTAETATAAASQGQLMSGMSSGSSAVSMDWSLEDGAKWAWLLLLLILALTIGCLESLIDFTQ